MSDVISRTRQCQIVDEGARVGMDCEPGLREDVWTTPTSEKPRVIFLGGSSVRAVSEEHHTNFPQEVAALLPEVEVLNFGSSGLYAANIAALSADLAPLNPSLVVIYSGHNDYSAAAFEGEIRGTRLWALPIYAVLQESWIYGQLSRRQAQMDAGAASTRDHRPGATNLIQDDVVFRIREAVDLRLANDLSLAVEESPAPVLICTLLRNPDFPPSGVLAEEGTDCSGRINGGVGPSDMKKPRTLRQFEKACGESAITEWVRHHVLFETGDEQGAVAAWYRSLELDALPLRAPPSADQVIREVAAETGATLVDLEAEIGPLAPGDYFVDTLHFNLQGDRAVAATLAPRIRAALSLDEGG